MSQRPDPDPFAGADADAAAQKRYDALANKDFERAVIKAIGNMEGGAGDVPAPPVQNLSNKEFLERMCIHRTQLDHIRIKVFMENEKIPAMVTPAILRDFLAMLKRERKKYLGCEVKVKHELFNIWTPEIHGTQQIDAWLRKRLPSELQGHRMA